MEACVIATFFGEIGHPLYTFLVTLTHGLDLVLALRLTTNGKID
jgi:hypothetical protein